MHSDDADTLSRRRLLTLSGSTLSLSTLSAGCLDRLPTAGSNDSDGENVRSCLVEPADDSDVPTDLVSIEMASIRVGTAFLRLSPESDTVATARAEAGEQTFDEVPVDGEARLSWSIPDGPFTRNYLVSLWNDAGEELGRFELHVECVGGE